MSELSTKIGEAIHANATALRCRGMGVEIEHWEPKIRITRPGRIVLLRNNNAAAILEDARRLADEYQVTVDDVLLHQAADEFQVPSDVSLMENERWYKLAQY